jgi:DNA ligase-1
VKAFSTLFNHLDSTTKTNVKVDALAEYFNTANPEDKIWAIALLSHRRPKRTVNTRLLREWASEAAGVPHWLFEESYHVVGDLAETISLILPEPNDFSSHSLSYWINLLIDLKDHDDDRKKEVILSSWSQLDKTGRFIFNKLITGGFRIGISQKLMVRALSKSTGIDENILAHRLMGDWNPQTTSFRELVESQTTTDDDSRPYPFYLAYPLEEQLAGLGESDEWQAERKWDGIRGQLIVRNRKIYTWTRGEELVTDKYPEFERLIDYIPDGSVIDGEILAFKNDKPLPFGQLQTRIGRKNVSKNMLQKVPVILMGYDILEFNRKDIRKEPLSARRKILENVASEIPESYPFKISPVIEFRQWEELIPVRENSRTASSEGLMLKHLDSDYKVGRKKGDWWKWKVDPLTIDAVMIYAMRGHGRRANLYTDYTFAVWSGDELVPFTKAYSGLTDEEFRRVDSFVKRNTLERFGPVRSVRPELVFEIAFDGISKSSRHKSGIALRFPRMKRWRTDKKAHEANTLEDLNAMLEQYGQ